VVGRREEEGRGGASQLLLLLLGFRGEEGKRRVLAPYARPGSSPSYVSREISKAKGGKGEGPVFSPYPVPPKKKKSGKGIKIL